MRQKTMYGALPDAVEVLRCDDGHAVVRLRENIEEVQTEDNTSYTADEYEIVMPYANNLESRVVSNFAEWLTKAKQIDYDKVAKTVRESRNKLLSETDAEFAFDRFGLDIPSNITATNMLTVLKNVFSTFRTMVSGDWAVYRQALRDIPNQPGFPYNVIFPHKPE